MLFCTSLNSEDSFDSSCRSSDNTVFRVSFQPIPNLSSLEAHFQAVTSRSQPELPNKFVPDSSRSRNCTEIRARYTRAPDPPVLTGSLDLILDFARAPWIRDTCSMPEKNSGKPSRGFATIRSVSADLDLDHVLDRLRSREEVVGVVLIGSTARQPDQWSDIDLVVVLDQGPDFDLEFATIGSRPADLVFTNLDTIRKIADARTNPDGRIADLTHWMADGKVAFSRNQAVDRAPKAAHRLRPVRASDRERFFHWVELNVGMVKLDRYLSAGSAEYLDALHLLLDQAFGSLPRDAVILAGNRWTGEIAALKELARSGDYVLRAIESGRSEADPARRLALYRSALERVTEPIGGLWAAGETAGGWALTENGSRVRSRWERLLG